MAHVNSASGLGRAIPRSNGPRADLVDWLLIIGAGVYLCLQQVGRHFPLFAPGYALLAPFLGLLILSVKVGPLKRAMQSLAGFHLFLASAPLSGIIALQSPLIFLRFESVLLLAAFGAGATFLSRCFGLDLWDSMRDKNLRSVFLIPFCAATTLGFGFIPLLGYESQLSRHLFVFWAFLVPFGTLGACALFLPSAVAAARLEYPAQLRQFVPPWLSFAIALVCSLAGVGLVRALHIFVSANPTPEVLKSTQECELLWVPAEMILLFQALIVLRVSLWARESR